MSNFDYILKKLNHFGWKKKLFGRTKDQDAMLEAYSVIQSLEIEIAQRDRQIKYLEEFITKEVKD